MINVNLTYLEKNLPMIVLTKHRRIKDHPHLQRKRVQSNIFSVLRFLFRFSSVRFLAGTALKSDLFHVKLPPLSSTAGEEKHCTLSCFVAASAPDCFVLTLNDNVMKLSKWDVFVIPPQNSFALENVSKSQPATVFVSRTKVNTSTSVLALDGAFFMASHANLAHS